MNSLAMVGAGYTTSGTAQEQLRAEQTRQLEQGRRRRGQTLRSLVRR